MIMAEIKATAALAYVKKCCTHYTREFFESVKSVESVAFLLSVATGTLTLPK
jgi:hypothetical protein